MTLRVMTTTAAWARGAAASDTEQAAGEDGEERSADSGPAKTALCTQAARPSDSVEVPRATTVAFFKRDWFHLLERSQEARPGILVDCAASSPTSAATISISATLSPCAKGILECQPSTAV
ncbi:hypothetical protein E2562_021199 [Oryza meyeriana var. granulata]|uniref:Uncharacterized protein n=1 Tax=Oryza meyeriana var. granulata TaxID=110450 RepID=A0A6G1DZC3_9ORYZ|nr:hypothetical protein E2562_021199 [Oryza meyeriana var. granulata]